MRISDWSSDVCSSDLEFALAGSEPPDLRGGALEHFDRVDALAHLHAVGADVLDRRGADGAGDQGEVFHPAPPHRNAGHYEAVPRHPAPAPHKSVSAFANIRISEVLGKNGS